MHVGFVCTSFPFPADALGKKFFPGKRVSPISSGWSDVEGNPKWTFFFSIYLTRWRTAMRMCWRSFSGKLLKYPSSPPKKVRIWIPPGLKGNLAASFSLFSFFESWKWPYTSVKLATRLGALSYSLSWQWPLLLAPAVGCRLLFSTA